MTTRPTYDYRNCQSLFGYAAGVHGRSGGICQLCGCGSTKVDFDLWRQLTVEHLIGASQGGYPAEIRGALSMKYPQQPAAELTALAGQIDEANTVTACGFCNSTTSRTKAPQSMPEIIGSAPDEASGCLGHVQLRLQAILDQKRADVAWKLEAVRNAFEAQVVPVLLDRRARGDVRLDVDQASTTG